MPEKFIKFKESDDGRRKIPTSMHGEIRSHYAHSGSQRDTAAAYGVSRRLIQFIVNPEQYESHRQRVKRTKPWLIHYHRPTHTKAVHAMREKKKLLNLKIISMTEVKKRAQSTQCPRCAAPLEARPMDRRAKNPALVYHCTRYGCPYVGFDFNGENDIFKLARHLGV